MSTSIKHIPLIDLDIWRNGDSETKKHFSSQVDKHLKVLGFLLIKNHGLDQALTTAARQAAKQFFALSSVHKQRYACPKDAYRGWIAPGLESNASSYGVNQSDETIVDQKEAYSIGPVFSGFEQHQEQAPRWYADNIWPEPHVPGFKKAFTDWWFAADTLTKELLNVMNAVLDLEPNWTARNCNYPMATVTANFYPAGDIEETAWRVGEHTDFGTITILDRDANNGLQIEVKQDHWIDAPVVDGTLLVNLGEMMVNLSGNRWRANPHRVVALPNNPENLSLIYFHDPNFDLDLPLKKPNGEQMTAAEFLQAKMDQIIQG